MKLQCVEYCLSVVAAHIGAAIVVDRHGKVVAANKAAQKQFYFEEGVGFCALFENPEKAQIDLTMSAASPRSHLFTLSREGHEPWAFFGSPILPNPILNSNISPTGVVLLRVETQSELSERFNNVPTDRLQLLDKRLKEETQRRETLEREKASLEKVVQRDQKTMLLTQDALDAKLRAQTNVEPDVPIAMIFLDLNDFKKINDSLGHDAGDVAIIEVGRILRENLRKNDVAARLGGDEFAIVLLNTHSREQIDKFVTRLHRLIAEPIPYTDPVTNVTHTMRLSFSAGIAQYPKNTRDITLLVKYADRAMYGAKARASDLKATASKRDLRPQ